MLDDFATVAARAFERDGRASIRSVQLRRPAPDVSTVLAVIRFRDPVARTLFLDEMLTSCGRGAAVYSVGAHRNEIEVEVRR